ncbi:MAG: hypothetical protein HY074_04425 [Deltaproteobacteria bacterium]|nr:hypothetical protein [Deltaproteobacteria bacterium]
MPALIAFLATFALHAAQAPLPRAPAVLAHWVAADGTVDTNHDGSVRAEWTWTENPAPRRKAVFDDPDPTLSFGGPALRVYLHTRHIPQDWVLANTASDDAALITLERTSGGDPRLRRVVLDVHAALTTIGFTFRAGSQRRHAVLVLTVPSAPPELIPHKTCADFQLQPFQKKAPGIGRHFFLGLACAEDEGQIYFHVVRSSDSRWAYSNEEAAQPELLFKIDKSDKRLFSGHNAYLGSNKFAEDGRLFKIRTRDLEGRLSEQTIVCAPGAPLCKKTPLWREPE